MTQDCDLVKLEEALEAMDRRASLTMAIGGKAEISAMDLRGLVKAARGLSAAKAAYNHQREKLERQEVRLSRVLWYTLATSATVMAMAEMVGLT